MTPLQLILLPDDSARVPRAEAHARLQRIVAEIASLSVPAIGIPAQTSTVAKKSASKPVVQMRSGAEST